jgi:hypothetical protein
MLINFKKIKFVLIVTIISILTMSFAKKLDKEKDPLHKRKFNVTYRENKEGGSNKKGIASTIEFKDGKLWSDFIYEKFQLKWLRYRINKDSVYTDSTDTEVRYLEVEATITDENNQTVVIAFNTVEWDIEGTLKITKNDKLKKSFDFVGREKGGKPPKDKKKKNEEAVEEKKE